MCSAKIESGPHAHSYAAPSTLTGCGSKLPAARCWHSRGNVTQVQCNWGLLQPLPRGTFCCPGTPRSVSGVTTDAPAPLRISSCAASAQEPDSTCLEDTTEFVPLH